MRKKQLEITKDNYEGYLELYKLQQKKLSFGKNIIRKIISGISALIVTYFTILSFFSGSVPLILGTMIGLSLCSVAIDDYVINCLKNKELKKLQKEYPYLDLNKKNGQIEEALKKVNKGKTTLDNKKWQNYYACEEIRKETLTSENRQYQSYIYESNEPEISSKEVKQKVKVLTKVKR